MGWHDRRIGIEIECESTSRTYHDCARYLRGRRAGDLWLAEQDGSLRGGDFGWEIKTRGEHGQPASEVRHALDSLMPLLMDSSGIWRAAVHTHVDARDLTTLQLSKLMAILYTVDQDIFNRFSPQRTESNFCVPLLNITPHVMSTIGALREGIRDVVWNKYSSCNFAALSRFGTVEFRHMQTPKIDTSLGSVQAGLGLIWEFALVATRLVSMIQDHPRRSLASLIEIAANIVGTSVNYERAYVVMSTISGSTQATITDADLGSLYIASTGVAFDESNTHVLPDDMDRVLHRLRNPNVLDLATTREDTDTYEDDVGYDYDVVMADELEEDDMREER